MSCIYSCPEGEEDKDGTLEQERGFCGVQRELQGLQDYVPSQRQIEVSRDVTFHEEAAFKKSRELQ